MFKLVVRCKGELSLEGCLTPVSVVKGFVKWTVSTEGPKAIPC